MSQQRLQWNAYRHLGANHVRGAINIRERFNERAVCQSGLCNVLVCRLLDWTFQKLTKPSLPTILLVLVASDIGEHRSLLSSNQHVSFRRSEANSHERILRRIPITCGNVCLLGGSTAAQGGLTGPDWRDVAVTRGAGVTHMFIYVDTHIIVKSGDSVRSALQAE